MREWQHHYLCVYARVLTRVLLSVKLSDLKSMAQSTTTCKPFENPSNPCSVNQKDCRLSRIREHVVMGVNWM